MTSLDSQVFAMRIPGGTRRKPLRSKTLTLVAILFLSLVLASVADYLLVLWLGIPLPGKSLVVYRRVGPESGPQVFCAGSSLMGQALSWSKVSGAMGQGIESWAVGGSSPDIWEQWQKQRPHSDVTLVGVSLYDLNEMHLADARASVVPLGRTVDDLWSSHTDSALSHRILSQYLLKYVRLLLPTAGNADEVLVGLRNKAAGLLGRQASLAKHEGVMVEPPPPIMDVGESTSSLNDWPSDHLIRRLAVLRAENRGQHEFLKGPKNRALHRLLYQARNQGRVILVVLPVSEPYRREFIDEATKAAFEEAIDQAMAIVPEATLIRLDRLPGISDPSCFFDLVHMNSLGRRFATEAFLKELERDPSARISAASSSGH
jgi:hypothetical protein